MKEILWDGSYKDEDSSRIKFGHGPGCAAVGSIKNCERCGREGRMLAVCIECLDELRSHHEQFEWIWDMDPDDAEVLSDPGVREDVIMMTFLAGGRAMAASYYGISAYSMNLLIRHYRRGVALGHKAEVEIRERVLGRLRNLELPDAFPEDMQERKKAYRAIRMRLQKDMDKKRAKKKEAAVC